MKEGRKEGKGKPLDIGLKKGTVWCLEKPFKTTHDTILGTDFI